MTDGTSIEVRVLRDPDEFVELCSDWDALVAAQDEASPFALSEWLTTWWDVYREPHWHQLVLLFYAEDRLVGGMPLFEMTVAGTFPFPATRTLHVFGTGEPEWEEVESEYLDILALPGYRDEVCDRFWQFFRIEYTAWDRLILDNVLAGSNVFRQLLPGARKSGCRYLQSSIGFRFRIALPSTWASYLASLGRGMRSRINISRNRMQKAGDLRITRLDDPADIEGSLNELVHLHEMRWRDRGEPGAFRSGRFREFHRRMMRLFLGKGLLQFTLLGNDRFNIAALYNFRLSGIEYFYQCGFDVGQPARLRPGMLLHANAIESAIDAGLSWYDFMRGDEGCYKEQYQCEKTEIFSLVIYNRTFYGRLYFWLARMRTQAVRIRNSMLS